MKKSIFAAMAVVAMFVASCGPTVEYETLKKDYNNQWEVSAVVPKGVYTLNDTLPAAIPADIQNGTYISKPLYLAGDKVAIGFTKGEITEKTFAEWATFYKGANNYKDINIAGRNGFRQDINIKINGQPTCVGYEYYVEAPEIGNNVYFLAVVYPTTEIYDDFSQVVEGADIVQVLDSLKFAEIK